MESKTEYEEIEVEEEYSESEDSEVFMEFNFDLSS